MCKIYLAINFALFYLLFSNQWNFEYFICLLLNICFGEIDANKNCTIRNRWTCEYVKKKDELTWGGFVDLGHTWILFKMQLKKGPKSTDRIFHWIIPHKQTNLMSQYECVWWCASSAGYHHWLESGCCVSCDAQLNLNSFLTLY